MYPSKHLFALSLLLAATSLAQVAHADVAGARRPALAELDSLRFATSPGARIAGIDSRSVRCLNLDTGQEVAGTLPEVLLDETFDCARFGLEARDMDVVLIEVIGVAFGDPAFHGELIGFVDGSVNCLNRTTGQRVLIQSAPRGAFDCLAAGLELMPEDGVAVQMFGLAGTPPQPDVVFVQRGLRARKAVCQNDTDPQVVVIDLPGDQLSDAIDCGGAGLQVAPGDQVTFQIVGGSLGEAYLDPIGLAGPLTFRCENKTTGQTVTIVAPTHEFSCAAAGVEVTYGDVVAVTARGVVAQ